MRPPSAAASTRRRRGGAPTPHSISTRFTFPSTGRGRKDTLTSAPDPDLCDGWIAQRIGDQLVMEVAGGPCPRIMRRMCRHRCSFAPNLDVTRENVLLCAFSPSHQPRNQDIQKEGYLDEQFCQIEDLQDEASPNFTEEVVSLFFKDSARLIANLEQAMDKNPRDFNRWDAHMQQLKGSCSSIGASRLKHECASFRSSCGDKNAEGCMTSFQKLKREHGVLRQKLESYFQMLKQAGPAETRTRPSGA